ncbi:hypothetical protein BDR03DRAFT_944773 [Suillus americanus]|nr:hypothetical protein BDR03DRAFT_944773 [Suillus americanus]
MRPATSSLLMTRGASEDSVRVGTLCTCCIAALNSQHSGPDQRCASTESCTTSTSQVRCHIATVTLFRIHVTKTWP